MVKRLCLVIRKRRVLRMKSFTFLIPRRMLRLKKGGL